MPMAALSPLSLHGAARPVRARLRLACFACALLVACADPGPQQPSIAATEPTALGLSDAATALVAQDWWTAFGDPALERQMAQALHGHPSLELARARLARAQALAFLVGVLVSFLGLAGALVAARAAGAAVGWGFQLQ